MAPRNENEGELVRSIRRSDNPWRAEQAQYDAEPHVRHPYAHLSAEMDTDVDGVSASVKINEQVDARRARVEEVSMTEFDAQCRRIFMQYVPVLERPKLPARYRDFMARNRSRSAISRRRVLDGLRKYDLSDGASVNAQFNREEMSITDEKLRQIEKAAD